MPTRIGNVKETTGGPVDFRPVDTGLSAVNLKSQAKTTGTKIHVGGCTRFLAVLEYILAGAAATLGTAVVKLSAYDAAGTKLINELSLLTLTSTEAAGTYQTGVGFGTDTAGKYGTGTITAANLDCLKALHHVELVLDVTTAYNNGSTATASVTLVAL